MCKGSKWTDNLNKLQNFFKIHYLIVEPHPYLIVVLQDNFENLPLTKSIKTIVVRKTSMLSSSSISEDRAAGWQCYSRAGFLDISEEDRGP